MTNAMKRTTATLITVLTAFGIACSPEGEPRSINPGLTPEPKTTPPAAATARATETLVLPPATPQKTPERMTVIPPATPDKALIINGAKDTKTINDLRMAVPIDAKIQVVADSQSLKVAIVVPTIKIYGESYLMVAGQDGKWFRPDAIENMADSGGKFTVTKTTFGEGTKGGGQIYGVSLEIPFATQKKAEFAQCVEDGRTSGYKNGCTDGILTLPDGRRFVAYSMGERVIALQDLVYKGKLYLSNDKGFPLTADNGNAPKTVQVAYAGEMANLGVLELNQRFVVAGENGGVSLVDKLPFPPTPNAPKPPEVKMPVAADMKKIPAEIRTREYDIGTAGGTIYGDQFWVPEMNSGDKIMRTFDAGNEITTKIIFGTDGKLSGFEIAGPTGEKWLVPASPTTKFTFHGVNGGWVVINTAEFANKFNSLKPNENEKSSVSFSIKSVGINGDTGRLLTVGLYEWK